MYLQGNYSVRFHLQHGKYYKFWQIRDLNDKGVAPEYINPVGNQLVLLDCELYCNESKARKVYEAGVKDVCGWIKCKTLYVNDCSVYDSASVDNLPRISFNPIVDTCWRIEGKVGGFNNTHVDSIITSGSRCYLDVPCCVT